MRRGLSGLVVLVFLAAGCGDSGTATPDSPTGPSSPTVTSVTITGTLTIGNTGQTSQMSATAHFAKGTSQNVTTTATWASSDAAVATISPTGLITSMGIGAVTITATYQNVSGTTRVTVTRPPAYVLSGVVTESVPTTSIVLSGVRVDFTDAANQGRFATTDSTGHYEITQLPGGNYTVRAALAGYEDSTKQVAVNANATLDFGLIPAPKTTWFTRTGDISGSSAVCYETSPCQVFSLPPVHSPGPLEATLLWSSADTSLALQLFNVDTGQVLASASATGQLNQFISTRIQAPGTYQLRVVALRISGSVPIRLNVTACPN